MIRASIPDRGTRNERKLHVPNRLDITEASEQIRSGRLSPVELLQACLSRIDAVEERVRAWVTVDREGAEAQARHLEEALAHGHWYGPLHGIPVGIKDIMYTRGLRTCAGSKFLEDFVPDHDATVVSRLRGAGAVILGKTVTTEFACYDPAETRNPWNLHHTPGGSSSGSAAAVASRMCPAALGSQTGGSISRPAAYCGITGIKPTRGRVSVYGVFPISLHLDHVGPLCRSVADGVTLLKAIAGADANDPSCPDAPDPRLDAFFKTDGQRPPRIGRIRSYFEEEADAAMLDAVSRAVALFGEAGATLREVRLPDSFGDVHRMHRTLMFTDAAAVHQERFRRAADDFRPSNRAMIREGLQVSGVAYAEALNHRLTFRKEIRSAFSDVECLLTPAAPAPAPHGLESTGDPSFNSPWSYCGLPTVVLPVSESRQGLPTAVQLIGRPYDEVGLLSAAHWCEERLGWRSSPKLS